MVGGNQLASRRGALRSILGVPVNLEVHNNGSRIEGKCILEPRNPDKGYFIKGTDAQIYLKGTRVDDETKTVSLDLSATLIQNLRKYEEALN